MVADQTHGSPSKQLRSYATGCTRETWDYVNWLTHAKNAIAYDAHIGVAVVSHFLSVITAVCLRAAGGACSRCDDLVPTGWLPVAYFADDGQGDKVQDVAHALTTCPKLTTVDGSDRTPMTMTGLSFPNLGG